MNPDQAEKELRARVSVTPQRVTVAKALLLQGASDTSTGSDQLLTQVLRANGARWPLPQLVLNDAALDGALQGIADAISWRLAAIEGLWSLIHSGLVFAMSSPRDQSISVGWTQSGTSSGFQLQWASLPVPDHIRRAPSFAHQHSQFLAEPDLYLHTFDVPNMHPQVSESFAEAVRCFRAELFTAALAMLGRASEGAWLELGESLLRIVPPADERQFAKQRDALQDPMLGTMKKVAAVIQLYERQEIFERVVRASEVKLPELRIVANWTDTVRDSRNTIHFGVEPAVPNTYEKLGVLLIGAVPNVRTLYRIKAAADAVP